jgi:hypothetical protein
LAAEEAAAIIDFDHGPRTPKKGCLLPQPLLRSPARVGLSAPLRFDDLKRILDPIAFWLRGSVNDLELDTPQAGKIPVRDLVSLRANPNGRGGLRGGTFVDRVAEQGTRLRPNVQEKDA